MYILVGLFECAGHRTTMLMTKTMVCVLGKIRTRLSSSMYAISREGLTTPHDRNRRHVECGICGKNLWATSLNSHLETQYCVYRSMVNFQDLLVDREPVVYQTHLSVFGTYECPIPGCIGKDKKRHNLQKHFQVCHPQGLVNIAGEGFFPQCVQCGM